MKQDLRLWRPLGTLVLVLSAWGSHGYCQAPGLHIQLGAGHAFLNITGVVNTTYTVQYTTDLTGTNSWVPLLTNLTLPSNPYVLADATLPAAGRRFYRVMSTPATLLLNDGQVEDMCSRTCDYLTANSRIPETITIGGQNTNAIAAAELHSLMAEWLRNYRATQLPPASVTIVRGTLPPVTPSGVESGRIYLADILAAGDTTAKFIGTNSRLPDFSTVGAVQYTTKAMFSVFARTINWYQDHSSTMPTYATLQAVTAPDSWSTTPPPSGLKVAIFSDTDGGSTDSDCLQATISILTTNSGFIPSTISAASIRAGGLAAYDVVMFPGGGGTGQATALQQTGCAKVEQFVANGGGYVGTCAGAYLAALGYNTQTLWLQLVDAQVIDVEHWNRGVGLAQIHLVNSTNPILAGFPEYITARYVNGPLLGPGNSPDLVDYEQDAIFVSDIHDNAPANIMPDTTCMTTSTYQLGRCVLFSFHPELTAGLEQMDVRAVKWAAAKLPAN